MQNYLCKRFWRTKVNGSFSNWTEYLVVVPQGCSMVRSFAIQNIFKWRLSFNLCSYADDNILFAINKNLNLEKSVLEVNFAIMQRSSLWEFLWESSSYGL